MWNVYNVKINNLLKDYKIKKVVHVLNVDKIYKCKINKKYFINLLYIKNINILNKIIETWYQIK